MEPEHELLIHEIHSYSNYLLNELSSLPDEAWEIPSHCHMWAVKDVVSHMIAVDGFFINSLARSLQGDSLPPEGMPNPGTSTALSMAGGISSRAIQISETDLKSSKALLSVFSDLENQILESFKNVTEDGWKKPAYHPMNTLSPELLLGLKHMENVIHSWDIFNSIDTSYTLDDKACLLLCNLWQTNLITDWFFTPDETQLDPVAISIDLKKAGSFTLTIWNGILSFTENGNMGDKNQITSLRISPANLILLLSARTSIESLLEKNEVTVKGDQNIFSKFHTWFRGT